MRSRPKPPEHPGQLSARRWARVLKRSGAEFMDDALMDRAAALTYYAVLAFFPGLIVLVAILGLAGQHPQTTDALLRIVEDLGPASAVDTFEGPIQDVIENKGGASALLGFGLLGALWAASGYVGAFMRAANAIYEVDEGRPFWKLRPLQIAVTLVGVVAMALVAISLVVTGPLAESIGAVIGLGDTAVAIWDIAKWPAVLAIVMAIVAGLFYVAPNVQQPKLRWVSPGGFVAVILWVAGSAGFAFYVSNFGSYNKTYGALGGVVTFLVWIWVSNMALLFGAELDAELERERELAAGLEAAEEEIQLPPKEPAEAS
ncbi:MAG TPA: YihY/virulence factor BrkB family protein [Thermoleophilaceae bacterium]|nr:YihY/virulence factor BrkB family protein [Thermoleophilaceae bacterium]